MSLLGLYRTWPRVHHGPLNFLSANGFLLLIVGACASHLELSSFIFLAMTTLLIAAAYTDMVAWLVRPITGHAGLLPEMPVANMVVFVCFSLTIVGQLVGFSLFVFGAWSRYQTIVAG